MKTILSIVLAAIVACAFAQNDNFKPGRYYDKKGSRIEGYIDVSQALVNVLKFKATPDSVQTDISLSKVKAFVIEKDSFAILRNFIVESNFSNGNMRSVSVGLGKVLETGKTVLYQVYYREVGGNKFFSLGGTTVVGGNRPLRYVYILATSGNSKLTTVEMGIDDFVKQMTSYFKMNPELCQRIKDREFSYLKVQQLVKEFNDWYRDRNP